MDTQQCQLCGHACKYDIAQDSFDCKRCGQYKVTRACATALRSSPSSPVVQSLREPDVLSELAVYLHDQNAAGRVPTLEADFLLAIRPQPILARIDRMLARLANERIRPLQNELVRQADPWRLGAYDDHDVFGLLEMLVDQRFIIRNLESTNGGSAWLVKLTAAGWARAAELRRVTTGRQAFVAMAFTPDMMKIRSDAFDPAIRAAGYDPFLVSDREHNGRIDDRIEYEIKNSVFVVADFTEHRGGVYYEAGFAQGLGKPVIWTVEKGHVEKLHFDTRQFNHIVWSDAEELRTRLEARILNTVGKGPLA